MIPRGISMQIVTATGAERFDGVLTGSKRFTPDPINPCCFISMRKSRYDLVVGFDIHILRR